MNAILIDPNKKTIEIVKSTGKLDDIYRLMDCGMIEMPIRFPNEDIMYCNEEAWFEWNRDNRQAGFMFPNWDYPILGKVLIFGSTRNGNEASCKSSVSDFSNIIWADPDDMERFGRVTGKIY